MMRRRGVSHALRRQPAETKGGCGPGSTRLLGRMPGLQSSSGRCRSCAEAPAGCQPCSQTPTRP
eukprot:10407545-Alexandrium_andersonii.AAC.1